VTFLIAELAQALEEGRNEIGLKFGRRVSHEADPAETLRTRGDGPDQTLHAAASQQQKFTPSHRLCAS
jgi:hypothetical protein